MEGFHGGRGGGDKDVSEAFLPVSRVGFTIFDGNVSWDGVAAVVEKVEGLVRDVSVAGFEEGSADSVTDLGALGVDGLDIEVKSGSESVEDGTGGDVIHVGLDSGKSGAEGDLLDEDISGCWGKEREGNGGRGRVGTEGERFAALGASGGCRDDGGIELDHGAK